MQMPGSGLEDRELVHAALTREAQSRRLAGDRYYLIPKEDPASESFLPLMRTLSNDLPYWDMPQALDWYEQFPIDVRRQYRPFIVGGVLQYTADQLVARAKALVACNDRFYLLVKLLARADLIHTWLFDRCREVEEEPYGFVDLWARFHGKSSIITTGGIIQEIIRNPEVTVCIFSVTKGIAREFLAQIKNEFETNEDLKTVFYDVLYRSPRTRTDDEGRPAKWSLERGITVKRKGHPKEATVEAHGLIDGQPTGRHFNKHYYDDIVTQDNLTEEQLKKTTQRFEMADNLGTRHGVDKCIAGTRYHFADTYGVIVERGSVKARIYPATVDGTVNGQLVLISPKEWERIKRDQGLKTVSAQMLLNPLAGNEATFRSEWLSPYEVIPRIMNVYILVDPSKGSGERSDRTAIAVIGIDPAFNMYLIDGVCHRMRLTERLEYVERSKRYWENFPGVQIVKVGWERYGKDAEMEAVELLLRAKDNFFPIEELNTPKSGGHSKQDRIERLEPTIRGGRFHLPCVAHHPEFGAKGGQFAGQAYWKVWGPRDEALARERGKPSPHHLGQIVWRPVLGLTKLQEEFAGSLDGSRAEYGLPIIPKRLVQPLRRRDENKEVYDLTRVFMEEMIRHPYAAHDDLLDAASRIFDIEPLPPQAFENKATESVDVDNTGIDPGAPESEQDL